jgi:beta-aspartyl-peptidase (threonine type)
MTIALSVHGGAGVYPPEQMQSAQEGCLAGLLVGWNILQSNGSALDAVEAVVRTLEDNPLFNAGTGSYLTREGNIEMDAGIMDGEMFRVGAVAAVELIKNPIVLARKVLASPQVLLVGCGAQQFALEQGMSLCTREDLLTERVYTRWQQKRAAQVPEVEQKHGTVGAVAVDSAGRLAAATSTGGPMNKYPGRVGDSPLVGCGFYADRIAAISSTGYGEDFVRFLIARRAAEYAGQGYPVQLAAEEAMAFMTMHTSETGGLIMVDAQGNVGFAKTSLHMSYASMSDRMVEPEIGI